MTKVLTLFIAVLSFFVSSANAQKQNLLLNSQFDFHAFNNHRRGHRSSYKANNVAFWNSGGPQNINVYRESHVAKKYLPTFSVKNAVQIPSGKKLWQFFTLPEAALAHGDKISLSVYGWQAGAGALKAEIKLMKLDSEDGTWKPSDFGMRDKRSFPKHSRGELVVAKSYSTTSDKLGLIQLTIDGAEIIGHFSNDQNKSHSADVNTIGVRVEFTNTAKTPVWVYSPCLSQGVKAVASLPAIREMIPYYRHIPRITQKLWKGEPVHIIIMGSSIDRGSANPPMYPYDEDPKSPKYKQPLSDAYYKKFSTKLVGRPELEDYFAHSRHYFSYGGRLKRELMNKFNMPANKILINFMACDGSCVGEAHSGLKGYCSLVFPPSPGANGHKFRTPYLI